MIYGYCRISTDKQNIERQIRNILKYCPDAIIKQEVYTGTKTDGRKVFEQLLRIVRSGDTIIFDSVSRMSRNAETGFQVYQELYDKGVELVFIKEPHINSEVYRESVNAKKYDYQIVNRKFVNRNLILWLNTNKTPR